MDELERCIPLRHTGDGTCRRHRQEIEDTLAFKAFLSSLRTPDQWPTASEVLVVLHNIVTSSIDPRFNRHRRRFYCADEAWQSLRASPLHLDGMVAMSPRHRSMVGWNLPGVGENHLRNCSYL
mmetsp:Transcript_85356/g.242052  ORF Transcript_85356/g.242052 Transcript_85356/m.242052 type:complete len:123 (-) Transcript_85356:248-616(-)